MSEQASQRETIRAFQRARRKRFYRATEDLTQLDFAELSSLQNESSLQSRLAPAWSPDRYRWRRLYRTSTKEYTNRLLEHRGVNAGVCDNCAQRQVTHHVAYDEPESPRFAHYCAVCAPGMPSGWMVVATISLSNPTTSSGSR